MSESEDIIDLILTKNDITKVMKDDDKKYPIMINSEENDTSSENDSKIKQIPEQLKEKFLNEAITSYKVKCKQYIE